MSAVSDILIFNRFRNIGELDEEEKGRVRRLGWLAAEAGSTYLVEKLEIHY